MNLSGVPTFTKLSEGPDGGGGGGPVTPPAGGPAPTPSGAPPAPSPSAVPPSPPSGTPPAGTPPPAPSAFTYPEDRSGWLPPDRAQSMAEQAAAQHRADAQRFRAMLEAGTGVQIREQEQIRPEIAQARQRLDAVYPGMSTLMSAAPVLMQIAQVLSENRIDPNLLAQLPNVSAGMEHQWERHAQSVLEPIHSAIAQDYGLQNLTPRQARTITQDFIAWVEEMPERAQRYTRGDRSLPTEYLDDYRSGFITPLRTQTGAAAVTAGSRVAGLPPAPRTSGIAPPPPPQAPLTEDQVHDAAWTQFNAALAGTR
jgi:hypothetical protein